MRTIDQIRTAALTRYRTNWREWLIAPPTGPISFTLNAPTRAQIIAQHEYVDAWLQTWHTFARDNPHLHLQHATRSTPFGTVNVATHLIFLTPDAIAGMDPETHAHWETATSRHTRLKQVNARTEPLLPLLPGIVELDDLDFDMLLTVADWFTQHPASGYTIRQVPVPGLHTKWLSKNRRLVIGLVASKTTPNPVPLPSENPDSSDTAEELGADLLDTLGLQPLPIAIDITLTDPADQALLHGLRHLRASVDDIAALPIQPSRVLIVENKESAFPITDTTSLVVIHSLGNNLGVLTTIPWLAEASVYYWGDLDRAGLTLLSRARSRIPALTSVLMDEQTLLLHETLINPDHSQADKPDPTLTSEERTVLDLLTHPTHRRLEQERLGWGYVQDQLDLHGITTPPQ
jgi:hypothetical protein